MRYLSRFSLLLLSFALCTGRLMAQAAATTGNGQISGTLTLKQAVDIAIKNNININGQDLTTRSYKISYDQSWEYMLPTLSASGGQSLSFGRSITSASNGYTNTQFESGSASASANLVLFKGLQYQNGLRAARYAFDASKLDLQTQKDNITLNVVLQYLLILSNRDQLALAAEQAQVDSVQLERLKVQGAAGNLNPMSNLTDLQGQYSGDLIAIATAVNTLEQSKVNLFNLMNIPYNNDIQYQNDVTISDISQYPANSDSIFRTAMQIYPNIRSTELKVHQYDRLLAQARGAYYPSITFGASVGTNWTNAPNPSSSTPTDSTYNNAGLYSSPTGNPANIYAKSYTQYANTYPGWWDQFKNNRGESIGINVSIPILNGFQTRNQVRNAKLNLINAELNRNTARNTLQQNVESYFQNMIAAYKTYKFYIDQAKAYEESFRIQNIRFNEGVITSDVYIQAKGRRDIAEVNLAAAKYIYIFRTKVLDYFQGRLQIP